MVNDGTSVQLPNVHARQLFHVCINAGVIHFIDYLERCLGLFLKIRCNRLRQVCRATFERVPSGTMAEKLTCRSLRDGAAAKKKNKKKKNAGKAKELLSVETSNGAADNDVASDEAVTPASVRTREVPGAIVFVP